MMDKLITTYNQWIMARCQDHAGSMYFLLFLIFCSASCLQPDKPKEPQLILSDEFNFKKVEPHEIELLKGKTVQEVMAHLKVPCGLRSMFLSKQLYEMESVERDQATSFFESIRNTKLFQWYAVRKPIESKVTLSASHEFFDMAAKILPKLKEARLLNCDD